MHQGKERATDFEEAPARKVSTALRKTRGRTVGNGGLTQRASETQPAKPQ